MQLKGIIITYQVRNKNYLLCLFVEHSLQLVHPIAIFSRCHKVESLGSTLHILLSLSNEFFDIVAGIV